MLKQREDIEGGLAQLQHGESTQQNSSESGKAEVGIERHEDGVDDECARLQDIVDDHTPVVVLSKQRHPNKIVKELIPNLQNLEFRFAPEQVEHEED
eukprot:CAMPEP_0202819248 /NCGR_PEP_ID=MMETSP1389-20130828/8956_1 /ASSEMBLY_ACC=CAM_ASM_000865 /TAXON_ID=302021 /ORGANISM="Rhodomonas sp., Strain CCMP768" /LENGTH=96 /DNA_ID=CAMNT_0049491767 /DNA_START=110 /DNA_END=398 /DNA_ORIENTATION=-